jgi:membrane-bound serine protease (ClpP class)
MESWHFSRSGENYRLQPLMRLPALFIAILFLLGSRTSIADVVHVVTIDGGISPATADFLHGEIQRAKDNRIQCLVIRLNTPGGLLESTRDIVSDFLTSSVPIVVYVSPAGSQSASAGAFVTLAAHIAAMAPGTNIGAAHPVGLQGDQPDSIMAEKATNDAAAFIRAISEKRKRNVEWAEKAVRKSISNSETEALREGVIDLIAPSLEALLDSIDGRTVEVDGGTVQLQTREARVVEIEMSFKHKVLEILSNPNIAYIFLLLGMYGLFFELYNPGSVLPGVVGVISLILAFYSLNTLPVSYAGLALIIVGIVLFLLEIKITSYGLLTIGGLVALFLGSIMLIDPVSPLEIVSVSMTVIVPIVLLTAAFFAFVVGAGVRAQLRKPSTGAEGLVGLEGSAVSDLNPDGQVMVHGEIWNASTAGEHIRTGTRIRVIRVTGLTLIVGQKE